MSISDQRMAEIIRQARNAATTGVGGGDGSLYRETFSAEAYKATLNALVEIETRKSLAGQVRDLQCRVEELERKLESLEKE